MRKPALLHSRTSTHLYMRERRMLFFPIQPDKVLRSSSLKLITDILIMSTHLGDTNYLLEVILQFQSSDFPCKFKVHSQRLQNESERAVPYLGFSVLDLCNQFPVTHMCAEDKRQCFSFTMSPNILPLIISNYNIFYVHNHPYIMNVVIFAG